MTGVQTCALPIFHLPVQLGVVQAATVPPGSFLYEALLYFLGRSTLYSNFQEPSGEWSEYLYRELGPTLLDVVQAFCLRPELGLEDSIVLDYDGHRLHVQSSSLAPVYYRLHVR